MKTPVQFITKILLLFVVHQFTGNSLCGAGINKNSNGPNWINPSTSQHDESVKGEPNHLWLAPETDAENNGTVNVGKSSKEGLYCDIFYMLVSTIDGRVSALNLHNKGSLVWSVQADTRPLYSSSLTNMEVTHKGKKIRLIPSLDGALYQFDGDKLEALPLSAETLLSTTYRLSDDSMIVGSQDARNFGVDLHTGKILFTCGSEGCSNFQEGSQDKLLEGGNFLILTRTTQVVRSVDVKHGYEKWNFSVGQHQIKLLSAIQPSEVDERADKEFKMPVFTTVSGECPPNSTDNDKLFQVLLPEGQIVAFTKKGSSQLSWEYKFDCPIANAWLLRNGKLEVMSLSDEYSVPSLSTYTPGEADDDIVSRPLLYIGSHQRLLYIQTSQQLESTLESFTSYSIGHLFDPNIKVSWKPYLNTASVRTPILRGNRPHKMLSHKIIDKKSKKESTSLAVWNEDYPFDTGYFLYPEFRDIRSRQQKGVMLIEDFATIAGTEKRSFWKYWRDVMLVSAAILTIHMILSRIFRHNNHSITLDICPQKKSDVSTNVDGNLGEMMTSDNSLLLDDKLLNSGEYVSRFATDFDCLHCLGKGGFGIVFEAVNKVDDQHYAVKRITLPKNEGAKEKVLREVKALAKLEHIGIVRYFNSWVESPPAGWQEERDRCFHVGDTSKLSSATSNIKQYAWDESPCATSAAAEQKEDRNRMRDDDKYLEADTYDSVLFSSETAPSIQLTRECKSGTFSVHSGYSDMSNGNETDLNASDDSVFPYSRINDYPTGSISDDRLDFLNCSFKPCALFSDLSDKSREKLSNDGFKPERANSTLLFDNHLSLRTNSASSDSVAFEKCDTSGENHKEIAIHNQHPNHLQHGRINISVSSNVNDIGGEKINREGCVQRALCESRFFLYIQMQLYRKETLKDWLSSNTLNRNRHTVLNIFHQIACAVDYVHTQGLMHRDLKPSNIFFTVDEVVKIGDFGLVTALHVQQDQELDMDQKYPDKHTAEVGTTLYMSPEQIARRPYDFKIDIFSLGLILLELLVPFFTEMERIKTLQDARVKMLSTRIIRELPQESDLVHRMTDPDPNLRPAAKEILDHPLFLEYASTRMESRHRRRTVSTNSTS